ncbi:NADP-dependent oxidoreductase [Lentilactobacillus kosonis]|uniref:Bifunctional protein: zinc-containing alcohol dehydrogenase, quinone oxidoreductase n=1 Tax=Lentilactobacillus kosonis TaxID=2810561 RepID=A0A401FNM6_9LACO|nr:NADP-dependent oxidoreductase [Lentilactobacillus kosonis]GAY73868.1 bifunctional protein: zinc-containing alcohol dehydrogenase, quinone oxidoreductase [Lentilactobacillus kosonis]
MQAFGYDHNGGPDVFTEYIVPTPTLKNTDILIQTQAFGLNNFERSQRAGVFGETTKQIVPGRDVAGIVKSVGSEVTKFQPGDRVVAHGHHAYAEFATSSEANTVKIPDSISFEDAAAIVTTGITAYKTLHFFGQVKAGQTVIVKGASGGVGSVAAQLAEGLGAHVIGIGSSKNADYVKSLGISQYVAYDQETPADVLKDKADVVINSAMNGAGGDEDVAMVKSGGVIASVAMDEPETTKNVTFKHIAPTSEISDVTALQDIVDLMAQNKLSIKIGYVLPFTLDGVQKGHQILEESHDGRVIISKNA